MMYTSAVFSLFENWWRSGWGENRTICQRLSQMVLSDRHSSLESAEGQPMEGRQIRRSVTARTTTHFECPERNLFVTYSIAFSSRDKVHSVRTNLSHSSPIHKCWHALLSRKIRINASHVHEVSIKNEHQRTSKDSWLSFTMAWNIAQIRLPTSTGYCVPLGHTHPFNAQHASAERKPFLFQML